MTPDRAPLQVLLVEGDEGDRAIVEEALSSSGFAVTALGRLDDALRWLDDAQVDVVVADLGLPDSEGLITIERLEEAHPSVPIVVLAGRDDEDVAAHALQVGAQDVVVKGSAVAERLDRVLRHAVERQLLRDQLERTLRHQAALVRLGQLAFEGSRLQDLAPSIGRVVARALDVDTVVVLGVDDDRVRPLGGHGLPADPGFADGLTPLVRRAIERGGTQVCHDFTVELDADDPIMREGYTCGAISPIRGADGTIGALGVLSRARRTLLPTEAGFLDAMSRAVGEASRRLAAEAALRERVKEQTAVAEVAKLVQRHPARPELVADVAPALAVAMQHPDLAGAEVAIDGDRAEAGPTPLVVELRAPIVVAGEHRGSVRVGYTDVREFLDEERSLVGTIAESLATWVAADDAEAARGASEQRVRTLLEQQPGSVWTTDRDLVVTSVVGSPNAAAGMEGPSAVGRSILEVSRGDDWVGPIETAHRAALDGERASYGWERDGRTWHAQVGPLRDDDGRILGVIGGATDVTDRVAVDRELEASRQRLQGLFDHALEAILLFDGERRYVDVNPAAVRLLGLDREDIVGREVGSVVELTDADALDRMLAELETQGRARVQQTVRRGDGSTITVDLSAVTDIVPGLHLLTARDVSGRVAAERALRASEERFRRLAENAPDLIYRVALEPEPRFEYLSPAIEAMTGYTADEIRADPELGRRIIVEGGSVLDVGPGDPMAQTLAVRHRDGSLRYLERRAVVVEDDHGSAIAVEAIARDVTETRRTERALRASEARLTRVLETMTEALMIFDRSGHATYANRAAEELFEASAEALLGRHFDDPSWGIRSADGTAVGPGTVEQVLATRSPLRGLVRTRVLTDGSTIAWETNAAPLRDAAGEFGGVVVSLRDVTERLHADRAVRGALEREREASEHLRHLDEMKNGFLQAVSHELRTPLTGVIGFSAVLERYRELPEAQVSLLIERLGVNARKLDRLLTDLLDVDRLSRGTLEARRTSTDVDGLIRRTVADLDRGSARVRVHAGVLSARIDAPRTERIVENLVLNALKHSDGDVDVNAGRHEEGLLLTVEDRGPGVPDHLKPRVFEPFQQGDTPAARVGGAGIGLTVVRTFAELHGGRAWVEDRPGGGSRFRVLLPNPGATGEIEAPAARP